MHPSLLVAKKKYYRFHRDHSHDTKECIQLKDKIKDLIHRGYLKKYMHGKEHCSKIVAPRKSPTEAKIDNQPTRGRVNMISRGAKPGGTCNEEDTPKRLQSNNIINFSDNDLRGIQIFMMILLLSGQK